MTPKPTYTKIINCIHARWRDGLPFAIWELRDATDTSTSSVKRTLETLIFLNFIIDGKRGYLNRHYRISKWWTMPDKVMESFELAKLMKLEVGK